MYTWAALKAELGTTKFSTDIFQEAELFYDFFNMFWSPRNEFGKHDYETKQISRQTKPGGTARRYSEGSPVPRYQTTPEHTTATFYTFRNAFDYTYEVETFSEIDIIAKAKKDLAYDFALSLAFQIFYELGRGTKLFYTVTGPNSATKDYDGTLTTAAAYNGFTYWHLRDLLDWAHLLGFKQPALVSVPGAYTLLNETAKQSLAYMDKSAIINRPVKKIEDCEFHETNLLTPPNIDSTFYQPVTLTTPTNRRYTATTQQKVFGYHTSFTQLKEMLLVDIADVREVLYTAVAQPYKLTYDEGEHGTSYSIGWVFTAAFQHLWDETHTADADSINRVKTIWVGGNNVIVFT